ncbi:MAG TPA: PIN domain-containing protein [Coleofasciculaceae cyanobacterium]
MRQIFADTFYWAALLNRRDNWYLRVKQLNTRLQSVQLITTDEVLTEFLNFFSAFDPRMRQEATRQVRSILQNDRVQVIPVSRDRFLAGLHLYEQRLDKGYSLTDCISMNTMQQLGISEVLTHDRHFSQEGFVILLEDNSSI